MKSLIILNVAPMVIQVSSSKIFEGWLQELENYSNHLVSGFWLFYCMKHVRFSDLINFDFKIFVNFSRLKISKFLLPTLVMTLKGEKFRPEVHR